MPSGKLDKNDAGVVTAPDRYPMVRPLDNDNQASPNTEDLMSLVQQGDLDAYQEIIRLYQKKVFRVISCYHRVPEDAMEVVQDTFLKLYMSRLTWERKTSFSAWLYRIAINASIDRYRRASKQKAESLEEMMEANIQRSVTAQTPAGPFDQLKISERRRVLEVAVRRLPARQREVVSLRYFGEMQLEEIAESLACPLGTVKSNLHKAIKALKEMLLESGDRSLLFT
jgi:RNA polymerase sigma-70 factor (ECF subfamily)